MRYLFGIITGVFAGCWLFFIGWTIEEHPFLTIRQWITGKSAIKDVANQAIDKLITPTILAALTLSGASIGFLIAWLRPQGLRYLVGAVAGACIGDLACTCAANLEQFQFFTIRRIVTGKSVMSEIVSHPTDGYIVPVLTCLFILVGAIFGMLITWSYRDGGGKERRDEGAPLD